MRYDYGLIGNWLVDNSFSIQNGFMACLWFGGLFLFFKVLGKYDKRWQARKACK